MQSTTGKRRPPPISPKLHIHQKTIGEKQTLDLKSAKRKKGLPLPHRRNELRQADTRNIPFCASLRTASDLTKAQSDSSIPHTNTFLKEFGEVLPPPRKTTKSIWGPPELSSLDRRDPIMRYGDPAAILLQVCIADRRHHRRAY